MKLVLIIVGVLLLGILVWAFLYGRARRRGLAQELSSLNVRKIELIAGSTLQGMKEVHKELNLDDFNGTVTFIEREFRPANTAFFSLLPREHFHEGFRDYWVIDMGVLLGELMRKHSVSAAEWAQTEQGVWKLKIKMDSGPFWWDPFEEAERLYAGKVSDPVMSLQLIKTLK